MGHRFPQLFQLYLIENRKNREKEKMKKKTILYLVILCLSILFPTVVCATDVVDIKENGETIDSVINALTPANTHIADPKLRETNNALLDHTVRISSPATRSSDQYLNISTLFIFNETAKNYLSALYENNRDMITGYGVDYTGYVVIHLIPDAYSSEQLILIENEIQNISTEVGLGSIPIRFKEVGELIIDAPQVPRVTINPRGTPETRWRPLIGGIAISHFDNAQDPYGDEGTLGFSARKNGITGFVTHGHDMFIGSQIYQPTTTLPSNYLGTVHQIGGTYSDSCWIPYNDCQAAIYSTGIPERRPIISYTDPQSWGDISSGVVNMAGIKTRSYGYVSDYLPQQSHPEYGTLYSQYIAGYSSARGDSGAPVYKQDPNTHNNILVGIQVGYTTEGSLFSPISGVISDLGITPMVS